MTCPIITIIIISVLDADGDYTPLNELLRFNAQQERLCVNVSIFNDNSVEQQESFWIILERSAALNDRINISHDRSRGEIVIPNTEGEIYRTIIVSN